MLRELLEKDRSIRSFDKSTRLREEELLDMIDCTRLCPSSANLQALKFIPVYKEDTCEKIFKATKWAGYLKDEVIPPKGCEPAAYIIILHDKNIAPNPVPFYKDTGIAAQTVLLRACEMGYGGCMIGSFDKDLITKELLIPENFEITLVLALGKAAEEPIICEYNGDIKYFRENGIHYVPKRSLEEITLKR